MSKVMIFLHVDGDLEFMLVPLKVPATVTMDNVEEWLATQRDGPDAVYTVVEVVNSQDYRVKQRYMPPPPPEYYTERVPEFSIFNHKQNGR